jgi:hypothetical protein
MRCILSENGQIACAQVSDLLAKGKGKFLSSVEIPHELCHSDVVFTQETAK